MTGSGTRLPDFFIVGAPKCATTSLVHYLGQHPRIGMCREKDTPFLLTGAPDGLSRDPGYRALFAGLGDVDRVGDAQVRCLYSRRAIENIGSLCERPRIIVSLRDPAEMLPSLHAQRLALSGSRAGSFADAWRQEKRSGAPVEMPPLPPPPGGSYHAAGRYCDPLRSYLDAFGAESVLVLDYAELTRDPGGVVASVYRFLGVDPAFVPQLPVLNARHRQRFPALRRMVNSPPASLRRAARGLLSQRQRARLARRLVDANRASARREPISAELREELVAEFAADQECLAALRSSTRRTARP